MNSLTRLKSIIKQMETQITENTCSSFLDELSKLNQKFKDDLSLHALFNMMKSLGNYLNKRLENAHNESVPVLKSIADIADIIARQPNLKNDKKQEMVTGQIEQYKLLQNKLSSSPAVNPADIQDLKAVILAIDWEISDETLGNFETEINHQLLIFNAYSIHRTLLKIIQNTGRYIAVQKANAHANSIFFLRSVFKDFEHLIESQNMPFKDKKKLLEKDIRQFKEFKLKISGPASHRDQINQGVNEDRIAPALSHVKPPSNRPGDLETDSPITALETDELEKDMDSSIITPALSGKSQPKNGPRDVMGDLFSIKESPADQLLDAIHLLDVHGSNSEQAMSMLDSQDDLKSAGIKNFTPRRIDTDPIPEIGDRLDEFFNLDTSDLQQKNIIETSSPADQGIITDENSADGIIPFDYEDEAEENIEDDEKNPMVGETVNRLKSYFLSFDRLDDDSWYDLVQEDIFFLKRHWQADSEKTALLDIFESVLLLLNRQIKKAQNNIPQKKDAQKGLWQKIKSMFSS